MDDDDEIKRLRVIEGGNDPRPYHGDGPEQIICRRCEADTGVASSEFVVTTIAPMFDDDAVRGGTKGLICVRCLARGIVTRIL